MIDTSGLGFYEVDGQGFASKNSAFTEAIKKSKPIRYNYNDDVFGKYDWTKEPEPEVSLREFYRRRAQALRDKYDYIVLQYSGGPDSQNVLDTFLENNIKLDEIVNINSYEKTQKVDGTTHNADYVYNVKPTIERIRNDYGNQIKFTVIDEIDMTKKVWAEYSSLDYYELLFNSGTFPSVWMMRGVWIKHVKHLWDKLLSGKKLCVILGADKTMLRVDRTTNRFYTNFSDIVSCDIATLSIYDKILQGHKIVEMFYHTIEQPDLPIKQAHTLKNTIEKINDKTYFEKFSKFDGTNFRPASVCMSKKFPAMNLRYEYYHKIVYPSWRTDIVTPKPVYIGNRSIDCWWVDQLDENEKKIWTNGFQKYEQSFGQFLKKNDRDTSTLPVCFSQSYYLE
jgi:hypothetical protein